MFVVIIVSMKAKAFCFSNFLFKTVYALYLYSQEYYIIKHDNE